MNRRYVSGRIILLGLLSLCLLISITGVFLLSFDIVSTIQKEAIKRESAVLLQAIKVTLNNDILTGNLYAATDRLNALVDESSNSLICFRVDAADHSEIYFRDDGNVCSRKDSTLIEENIYFDSENTALAFTIFLRYIPGSFNFFASSILNYLTLFGICLLILLIITYRFTKIFFSQVYQALSGHTLAQPLKSKLFAGPFIEIEQIHKLVKRLSFASQQEAIGRSAAQVAHDIRSPLSALNLIMGSLDEVAEEKRTIIRSATNRINDIANKLLKQSKDIATQSSHNEKSASPQSNKTTKIQLLSAMIDSIVSEKRVQYREHQNLIISSNFRCGNGIFIEIDKLEFTRALSNLINNSVEALFNGAGSVSVSLRPSDKKVSVVIEDNGKGIPAEVLNKIGEYGVSFGKGDTRSGSGSGLGIYHAKNMVLNAGGTFNVTSNLGLGTTVTMTFDNAKVPEWFGEKLILHPNTHIVSVDDDISIHHVWRRRLDLLDVQKYNISLTSFTSINQFQVWAKNRSSSESPRTHNLFLVDYEFYNRNQSGIELIEALGIPSISFLVTSHFENREIQTRCLESGIKIIPKYLIGDIAITINR